MNFSKLFTLNETQTKEIDSVEQYLKQHKIQQIFEEIAAKLIEERSSNPRKTLAEALKQIKEKKYYFNVSDFEAIFEYYDPFETKTAKITSVLEGLKIIGIESTEEDIRKRHRCTEKGLVYQNEFVDILNNEYQNYLK